MGIENQSYQTEAVNTPHGFDIFRFFLYLNICNEMTSNSFNIFQKNEFSQTKLLYYFTKLLDQFSAFFS